jgi:hypothetical protein
LKTAAEERDFDRENRKLDAELDVEVDLVGHNAEMKKRRDFLDLNKEEFKLENERERKKASMKKLEADLFAKKLGSESDFISANFKALGDLVEKGFIGEERAERMMKDQLIHLGNGQVYDVEDVIHEDTFAQLEMGKFTAKQIDELCDKLRERANDGTKSQKDRSNYWAGVAIYERFRGNKEGRMEEALDYSFMNNKDNPLALKCKMEYLWNRHPQQFHEGKMSIPHLKSQVVEIEQLLSRLVTHDEISDGERSRMEDKHKIALRALSRGHEEGISYREKFEETYEILMGE